MRLVRLGDRVCAECGLPPRFFHELDDGTIICCKHVHDGEDES